jgi:hypothetical protein
VLNEHSTTNGSHRALALNNSVQQAEEQVTGWKAENWHNLPWFAALVWDRGSGGGNTLHVTGIDPISFLPQAQGYTGAATSVLWPCSKIHKLVKTMPKGHGVGNPGIISDVT